MISADPPAAKGQIKVMGLEGYFCAKTLSEHSMSKAHKALLRREVSDMVKQSIKG
jgi:hypothetical protein